MTHTACPPLDAARLHALSPATRAVIGPLMSFIAQDGCTDAQFNAIALQLFEHQYTHNLPLQRFCQGRGLTPRRVRQWQDIPAVPIDAFKSLTLSAEPPSVCERVFMTSGTTRADQRGQHHHPVIAVWDLSRRKQFERHFMQGLGTGAGGNSGQGGTQPGRVPMATLFPPESVWGNSSLGRYLSQAMQEWGAAGSGCFVGPQGLDLPGMLDFLQRAQDGGQPVAVLGASHALVHLIDALSAQGLRFTLPAGSRVLDTGGYKGRSREMAPQDFYAALTHALGVPPTHCINMYGMTELSSQFYDAGNAHLPSVKRGPHWVRTRVVDPLTGADVPPGRTGVLVHCDLASFNAATTILTEDLGVAVDGGFHLLGRAEWAQARGCSLAVQDFLQGAQA